MSIVGEVASLNIAIDCTDKEGEDGWEERCSLSTDHGCIEE